MFLTIALNEFSVMASPISNNGKIQVKDNNIFIPNIIEKKHTIYNISCIPKLSQPINCKICSYPSFLATEAK